MEEFEAEKAMQWVGADNGLVVEVTDIEVHEQEFARWKKSSKT